MASAFDPNTFLSQEIVGASETKYTPIPIGEYQSFIDDVKTEMVKDNTGAEVPVLILTHAILSEELKKTLGLEKPTVQDRIFLDVDDKTGALLFGANKNVRLGRVREACGLNDPKKKFNFNMLRGCGPLKIMVDHRFSEKNGVKDGPFANITRITKA